MSEYTYLIGLLIAGAVVFVFGMIAGRYERKARERINEKLRRWRALPDGTRVRIIGRAWTGYDSSGAIWTTKYFDDPGDYRLTREYDGATTYASRDAIKPVSS